MASPSAFPLQALRKTFAMPLRAARLTRLWLPQAVQGLSARPFRQLGQVPISRAPPAQSVSLLVGNSKTPAVRPALGLGSSGTGHMTGPTKDHNHQTPDPLPD